MSNGKWSPSVWRSAVPLPSRPSILRGYPTLVGLSNPEC
jgi:hypothetical protein